MMRTCGDPETETTSSARCDWSEDDENHGNHISQQVAYFTHRHIIYCLAPFFKVNSTVATILVSRWLISHTDILSYMTLHYFSINSTVATILISRWPILYIKHIIYGLTPFFKVPCM